MSDERSGPNELDAGCSERQDVIRTFCFPYTTGFPCGVRKGWYRETLPSWDISMSHASRSMTLSALYCNFHVTIPSMSRLEAWATRESPRGTTIIFIADGASHTTVILGLQDRQLPEIFPSPYLSSAASTLPYLSHGPSSVISPAYRQRSMEPGDMAQAEGIDRARAGTVTPDRSL